MVFAFIPRVSPTYVYEGQILMKPLQYNATKNKTTTKYWVKNDNKSSPTLSQQTSTYYKHDTKISSLKQAASVLSVSPGECKSKWSVCWSS